MLDCLRCAVGALHSQKLQFEFWQAISCILMHLEDFMERKIGKEKDSA